MHFTNIDIARITESFSSALPLYYGSPISAIHRALMEAQHIDKSTQTTVHQRGQNADNIINALRANGYPSIGSFQLASIIELNTVLRGQGEVLLSIAKAVHTALQNIELLPPIPDELVIQFHASDDIRPFLESIAQTQRWTSAYRNIVRHLCQSPTTTTISVQTFLDLTPPKLRSWGNIGPTYTACIVALQKRIRVIPEV